MRENDGREKIKNYAGKGKKGMPVCTKKILGKIIITINVLKRKRKMYFFIDINLCCFKKKLRRFF